jgi:hypothetical protein
MEAMIGTRPPDDLRFNVRFKVYGFFGWNMRIGELAKISGLAPSITAAFSPADCVSGNV